MPRAFGNTGYKFTGHDPNRFILERAQAAPVSIPATYRTDTSALGVYNQQFIPDCVENGCTFVKRYFDWKSDGNVVDRSRRFLAILTAQDDGFPLSEGTNLANALKRMMKTGICESSLLADDHSLDINTFVSAPITQPMLDSAKMAVIQSYAFLSDTSFQGIKNAIYQNGVVILALKLDKAWWSAPDGTTSWAKSDLLTNNGHLRTPSDPATMGGHVCVAIGYTENGIIIQNSFGDTWCDSGFAMLGADYMPFIYEAATIIDMTPEQYRNMVANQDINTIDALKKVETPQNTQLVSTLIASLWQAFLDLFQKPLGIGRWSHAYGGVPRSPQWPEVEKEFAKYVPKVCPFDGSKRVQLHHSQSAFHQDHAQELNPCQLRWACEGIGTHNHHIILGHAGNFQSLWPDFDSRVDFFQHRPMWDGKEWKPTNTYNIKYKLTEDELAQWNAKFGTNWSYGTVGN